MSDDLDKMRPKLAPPRIGKSATGVRDLGALMRKSAQTEKPWSTGRMRPSLIWVSSSLPPERGSRIAASTGAAVRLYRGSFRRRQTRRALKDKWREVWAKVSPDNGR